MAKTKTMVLVFGFSFPFSAGFQGKSGFLGGRFRIFFFFSARGGEGGVRGGNGVGLGLLLKIPGGGGFQEGGGRGRGAGEGVWSELGDCFGGGPKYFFSGPKRPPSFSFGKKWF